MRFGYLFLAGILACGHSAPPENSTDAASGDTGEDSDAQSADSGPHKCGRLDDSLRLHQIQMKATHNSYHIANSLVPALDYAHSPLDVQLESEGVRSFELDIHPPDNPPGPLQVYHLPAVDQTSNCGNFQECLTVLRSWSDAHPCHHPLVVLIEPKDQLIDTGVVHEKLPLDDYWDQFDQEIQSVWPRARMLTPDDVRGTHAGLREAVTTDGWPTLGQGRGKLVVIIMDENGHGAWYRKGHPQYAGRMAFVFGPEDATDTAAVQYDNVRTPDDVTAVQALVKQGFLVRSFADRSDQANHTDDKAVQQLSLQSGAQMLTTDFPVSKPRAPGFTFEIPGGTPSRCNPVNAPAGCPPTDVENLK